MAFAGACTSGNDSRLDSGLARYINDIKAIDVHAHPLRYVAEGAAADSEYDALPLDGLPPFAVPYGLRPENPHYRDAQRALFGVSVADSDAAFERSLKKARTELRREKGEHFGEWILDHTGIEIMLANRIAMGPGLPAGRFRWIPFADALMLPLDTRSEAASTPDTRTLYPLEERLLKRYLADLHLAKIPATLDAYESQVVAATLEGQKAAGAVGIKFEAAYLRPLNFEPADSTAARAVYAKYAAGGTPTHLEYTLLQDHLFRVIARHAGRLALTIQIHSAEGFGGFYSANGAAPHQLESVFNDSTLRATRFVIVHGGWPRVDETMALLSKPNVYADISMMDILAESDALALTLRKWLNDSPEKVMFGTDAFDGGETQGWGQVAWVAAHNARVALTAALTGMMRDGEISRERAEELARMVMRENALKAYPLIVPAAK
ncbi:MAG: amidohydrolase [Gemmatimonadota bacterium]|nr:amidohydrolase [Gemmatimonadota bacterium]